MKNVKNILRKVSLLGKVKSLRISHQKFPIFEGAQKNVHARRRLVLILISRFNALGVRILKPKHPPRPDC